MEQKLIEGTGLVSSRIALGTWSIGGWMWGGSDEGEAIKTIRTALDLGITLIDTAPAYGFGRSEELVGRAIAEHGERERVLIATKAGLEWRAGQVYRNASAERIRAEVKESLRRLRTDYIDIYQVHWPDPLVALGETAAALRQLFEQGTIRAIGVSNFSPEEMEIFRAVAPLHVVSWHTARSAGACYRAACDQTRGSQAMIFARRIRSSSRDGTGNISMRSPRSTAWPASATAGTSWRWRFAGSWIKGRRSRSGAPDGPISFRRSRMCSVGGSTTRRGRPSIASWRRRSRTRSAPNSWLRRPARSPHDQTQHQWQSSDCRCAP